MVAAEGGYQRFSLKIGDGGYALVVVSDGGCG